MRVDTETYELLIVVENRVEMLQEQVTKDISAIVMLVEWILRYGELTDAVALVQVSLWTQLKDSAADEEAHRAELLGGQGARALHLTEDIVVCALYIGAQLRLPFVAQDGVLVGRHREEGAASVDDSWELLGLAMERQRLAIVVDLLRGQSPRADVRLVVAAIVLERGETVLTADDLGRVVAAE